MHIGIFGLGYVGAVSAGCLAYDGHRVIGVDPSVTKVKLINAGQTPVIEAEIGTLISDSVDKGMLSATTDFAAAVEQTDLSIICVGTPSQLNGSLDLSHVRTVCEQIGESLGKKGGFHVVVIRSTILPGTMRRIVIPTLEEYSGKRAGESFGVCHNPEFLREGSAVWDFQHPPKTVIGELDAQSGDILAKLYAGLPAPLIRTDIETAEMVKYTDNVWHALKVGFANEIGNICKALEIDGHQLMDIFCQDTKLNLSAYYMKPGFAFGGSCLPKDVRALTYKAKAMDIQVPILDAIMPSNELQIKKAIDMVVAKGKKKIGIMGFSFKAGTDDLRESPVVELIERLLGKGYDIRVYDKNVNLARLVGANRDYILNRIPHIARLMVRELSDIVDHGEVLIIGNGSDEFKGVLDQLKPGQVVVDLVRVSSDARSDATTYDGICW
ncbi:nucleotide sugar dehydrogenase [Rhabdochromatium marinum]|uniref:nucleotide sugar dehydrogenase n=1 Tax=Rhabdochromatium marinum TaxID=48729 RepID=UPI001905FA3E|nr:nucleotide sugar dehydrogenase [Rhabdochromatium marinum]MBK1647100.1 GDP-mannose dehydrogenase [Rhabdochromatium marinum]